MSKQQVIALVLLFMAALAIRLFRVSNQSLWMDEISSVETARVPMNEMMGRSAQNNALPTYFVLLRTMVGKANDHIEIRARLISAMAGAFSIPLFVELIFCWCGRWRTALIGGSLLVVNPLHLWYSQEARGYALMLLSGLCCLLCFEFARYRERSCRVQWWIGYVLTGILAAAIHKTGLVFPLTCALWDGWAFWGDRQRRKRRQPGKQPDAKSESPPTERTDRVNWIARLSPHLVLVVIAGLLLIEPSQPPAPEYGRPNSILEIAYTAMTFVGGYSFGPSLTEIQNQGAKTAVLHHLLQTGILAAVLVLLAAMLIWRWQSVVPARATLLFVLPVLAGFAGAVFSNFPYNVRYTLPALFGFLGLVAGLSTLVPRHWVGRSLIVLVLVISLWSDGQWFFAANYRKGDSRAVARWLVQHRQNVKSWTVLPDYLGYSIRWYLNGQPEVLAAEQRPSKGQSTSFPPVPDVLIIGRRHHVKDPDAVVKSYREAAGGARELDSFAGFELYVRDQN